MNKNSVTVKIVKEEEDEEGAGEGKDRNDECYQVDKIECPMKVKFLKIHTFSIIGPCTISARMDPPTSFNIAIL